MGNYVTTIRRDKSDYDHIYAAWVKHFTDLHRVSYAASGDDNYYDHLCNLFDTGTQFSCCIYLDGLYLLWRNGKDVKVCGEQIKQKLTELGAPNLKVYYEMYPL
jgi:hypothetical protein